MLRIIIGIFIIMHGLVHLLYFGQSAKFFELKPGLLWPAGSWVFAKLIGDNTTRLLSSVSCILAAVGFFVGGVGIFLQQAWFHSFVVGAAVFSTLLFLIFWDGVLQRLPDKGGVAILINITILVAVLVFRWPKFVF